jgi:hypothetical protein
MREYQPELRRTDDLYLFFLRHYLFAHMPAQLRGDPQYALPEGAPLVRHMMDAQVSYAREFVKMEDDKTTTTDPAYAGAAQAYNTRHMWPKIMAKMRSFATDSLSERFKWVVFALGEMPESAPTQPRFRALQPSFFFNRRKKNASQLMYNKTNESQLKPLGYNLFDIYRVEVLRPVVTWVVMESLGLLSNNHIKEKRGTARHIAAGDNGSNWRWMQCVYYSRDGEAPWTAFELFLADPRYVMFATKLAWEQRLELSTVDALRIEAMCFDFVRTNTAWGSGFRFGRLTYLRLGPKDPNPRSTACCHWLFYLCLEVFLPNAFKVYRDNASHRPLVFVMAVEQVARLKACFPPFFAQTSVEMGLEAKEFFHAESHQNLNWSGLPMLEVRRHHKETGNVFALYELLTKPILEKMAADDSSTMLQITLEAPPTTHLMLDTPLQEPPAVLFLREMMRDMLVVETESRTSSALVPRRPQDGPRIDRWMDDLLSDAPPPPPPPPPMMMGEGGGTYDQVKSMLDGAEG